MGLYLAAVCLSSAVLYLTGVSGGDDLRTYPTPPSPSLYYDQNCTDISNNCHIYGDYICFEPYEKWARGHCAKTCRFCEGAPLSPPPCQDKLADCITFTKSVCTDPKYTNWAKVNCRRYCRICPEPVLAELDLMITTLPPPDCFDKKVCIDLGNDVCTRDIQWAQDNCSKFCGFCKGATTTARPCADKLTNCNQYKASVCTDPTLRPWVEENCRFHCKTCHSTSPEVTPPFIIPPTLANLIPNPHGR